MASLKKMSPNPSQKDLIGETAEPTKRLRDKLLEELGHFSLICGMAVASAALQGCDDDEWYDEVRLKDCNNDNKIDTRDKACQDEDEKSDDSSSTSKSWDNHANVITYPNWADVSNW